MAKCSASLPSARIQTSEAIRPSLPSSARYFRAPSASLLSIIFSGPSSIAKLISFSLALFAFS